MHIKVSTLSAITSLTFTLTTTSLAETNNNITNDVSEICSRQTIECLNDQKGIIIGKPGRTANFKGAIDQASEKFRKYFGATAPNAAVVLDNVLNADDRKKIRENHPAILPWFTPQGRQDLIANSVRNQVKEQQPDITGEALEQIVERSVKASLEASGQPLKNQSDSSSNILDGALSHELGHLYFIRTYWSDETLDVTDTNPTANNRYGGPAPDWLDEMAAVLLENDALTIGRNNGLKEAAKNNFKTMWPLEEYFTMTHPAFEQTRKIIEARQQAANGGAQNGVLILSADELAKREDGRQPVMFYAQSRGFADYMIEKSGNERIFANIATFIAKNGSIDEWLSEYSGKYHIAPTIHGLEADFHAWLKNRY
jgi:hypothetical protein